MGKALTLVTIFNFMMLAQTSEVNEGPADLRVSVSIFDYAGVHPHVLAQAEKSITRLLGEAGLEVKRMECSSPAAPGRTSADCRKRLEPAEIVVRILPGFRPGDKSVLGHSLGAAYATVYYEGAVKFAGRQLASEGAATGPILGCVIVHEIGHLLLGPNQHSPRGMMRAQWSSEELKLITDSSLHFTAQQAEAIRAEVNRRNRVYVSTAR
jgi:hypothetical protein